MHGKLLQRLQFSAFAGTLLGFSLYSPQITQNIIRAEYNASVGDSVVEWLIKGLLAKKKENKLIDEAIKEGAEIKKDVYGHSHSFWDDDNLNYVIVGASGTGKSTFANAFCRQPYKFKSGFIETTHIEDIDCHIYEESGRKIVFWDIPGFGTWKYKPKEYFETFGLTRFDGVLLMTSTRFTDKDVTFYKKLREIQLELFHKMNQKPLEHVPTYIVRTKFDVDLESELKKEHYLREKREKPHRTLSDNMFRFIFGSCKFTHDQFMEIWEGTLTALEVQAEKQFKGVFEDNASLMSYFYIVTADWNNRMLTTYKKYKHDERTALNKHGGEEFGWHGIWRRILKDTLYFNGKGIQNDTHIKDIDIKCDERFHCKDELEITDSVLYKRYTQRTGGILNMHSVSLLTITGVSALFAYNFGAYVNTAPVAGAQRNWEDVAKRVIMSGIIGCFTGALVYQQKLILEKNRGLAKNRRLAKRRL